MALSFGRRQAEGASTAALLRHTAVRAATLVAIVAIGASQHQFGGVIHEGTHFILFENKKFNELMSDWLAAFPSYTSTFQFRLHHLAHHQFINDLKPFDELNPSAENLAKYFCDEIQSGLKGSKVSSVRVWETDTSCAVYRP